MIFAMLGQHGTSVSATGFPESWRDGRSCPCRRITWSMPSSLQGGWWLWRSRLVSRHTRPVKKTFDNFWMPEKIAVLAGMNHWIIIGNKMQPTNRMLTRMLVVQMSKHMIYIYIYIYAVTQNTFLQSFIWTVLYIFPLLPVCSVDWKV